MNAGLRQGHDFIFSPSCLTACSVLYCQEKRKCGADVKNLRAIFLAAACFLLPFAVYLATLAPTLSWRNEGRDGGDLVSAICTLGIPHPPGYPTYVLLGRLFALLPIGDAAYRANLMSAFSLRPPYSRFSWPPV